MACTKKKMAKGGLVAKKHPSGPVARPPGYAMGGEVSQYQKDLQDYNAGDLRSEGYGRIRNMRMGREGQIKDIMNSWGTRNEHPSVKAAAINALGQSWAGQDQALLQRPQQQQPLQPPELQPPMQPPQGGGQQEQGQQQTPMGQNPAGSLAAPQRPRGPTALDELIAQPVGGTQVGGQEPPSLTTGPLGQNPLPQGMTFRAGGAIADYRMGGPVSGGPPGVDTVPARLNNGEYVLPVQTTQAMGGKPVLDQAVLATTGKPPVGYENGGMPVRPTYDQLRMRGQDLNAAVDRMTGPPAAPQGFSVPQQSAQARVRPAPRQSEGRLGGGMPGMERKYGKGGQVEPGNIDLMKRPMVRNPDGSISTVRTIGIEADGRNINIPTVSPDGRIMSNREAIGLYDEFGKHLGVYDSQESAATGARQLHEDQARMYGRGYADGGRVSGWNVDRAAQIENAVNGAMGQPGPVAPPPAAPPSAPGMQLSQGEQYALDSARAAEAAQTPKPSKFETLLRAMTGKPAGFAMGGEVQGYERGGGPPPVEDRYPDMHRWADQAQQLKAQELGIPGYPQQQPVGALPNAIGNMLAARDYRNRELTGPAMLGGHGPVSPPQAAASGPALTPQEQETMALKPTAPPTRDAQVSRAAPVEGYPKQLLDKNGAWTKEAMDFANANIRAKKAAGWNGELNNSMVTPELMGRIQSVPGPGSDTPGWDKMNQDQRVATRIAAMRGPSPAAQAADLQRGQQQEAVDYTKRWLALPEKDRGRMPDQVADVLNQPRRMWGSTAVGPENQARFDAQQNAAAAGLAQGAELNQDLFKERYKTILEMESKTFEEQLKQARPQDADTIDALSKFVPSEGMGLALDVVTSAPKIPLAQKVALAGRVLSAYPTRAALRAAAIAKLGGTDKWTGTNPTEDEITIAMSDLRRQAAGVTQTAPPPK